MSQFHITFESNEDTYDSTDNIQDAIRIAREVARNEYPGELVFIEHKGICIRQFVFMPNGEIEEQVLV